MPMFSYFSITFLPGIQIEGLYIRDDTVQNVRESQTTIAKNIASVRYIDEKMARSMTADVGETTRRDVSQPPPIHHTSVSGSDELTYFM